jgi:poly-gamma-glutamate capsule biosynthesis protein CapA/YwtB (metallophosphatase superfamily)
MVDLITLFLAGDVMTGRGIDQILPRPGDPLLHEPYVQNAVRYVELAEEVSGPVPRPVDPPYIWGDALAELTRVAPDLRIINLETAITTSGDWWRGKEVHYRMHPANVSVLTAARIDCCTLANNHVLDWGYGGLGETLATLRQAGVHSSGAGANRAEAEAPAVLEVAGKGRVLVVACGAHTSGIPREWGAAEKGPGVHLLGELSAAEARRIGERLREVKRPGDIAVVSIHWGGNWGYGIPQEERELAHRLIESAGADVVHGHSSHHVKGIEVYRERLILYGCGDFLDDYEGIGGYEAYRGDLGLMYFPAIDPATGRLKRLVMTPTRLRRFRVNRAGKKETDWLRGILTREGERLGTSVTLEADETLTLRWE